MAALLERELPDLFAPGVEPSSAGGVAEIRRRGPSPAQPTAASLTAILAHEGIDGSVTAPSDATLRAVVPAGAEALARELLEPCVPYGVELQIAPADPG